MPRQGQSVETCIMGHWFKQPGDEVKAGELLFSYETDKSSFEEEAKADGFLLACFFGEGDEVPVLSEVALIGERGEALPEKEGNSADHKEGHAVTGEDGGPAAEGISDGEEPPRVIEFPVEGDSVMAGRISISPLARNMAEKLGVDTSRVQGSGPHGRIIARDVEAAAAFAPSISTRALQQAPDLWPRHSAGETGESRHPLPQAADTEQPFPAGNLTEGEFDLKPLSNMRKLIARAMHASLQNSAQLTHHLSADARLLLAARKHFKQLQEKGKITENVTINDLVSWAVIRALKKFPGVNAHLLGDNIKYFRKVHLGLAVDTDRGLMVAALRDADDLSLTGLSSRLQMLAAGCRKGSVNPDLLSPEAASFTISNLGNYGVEIFTPVINLPQVAILGVCTITPRPKELGDGVFAFVPHIGLSLTYDHRALDGGEATRFLAEIRDQIENLTL